MDARSTATRAAGARPDRGREVAATHQDRYGTINYIKNKWYIIDGVRDAFDLIGRALRSIQGFSEDEQATLLELVKIGRVRAAAAQGESATGLTVLAGHAFTWPEFDRWQAFFASRGTFPVRWEGLQAVPAPQTSRSGRAAYQLRKLNLLFEWLDTLGRGAIALRHYTRLGLRARIVRQDDGQRCAACDFWDGREVTPGKDTMPPIHPGCRCVLMAVTATRPARGA